MGCGAICGENGSPLQKPYLYSHQALVQLLPHLNKSPHFLTDRSCKAFVKAIQENPDKFILRIPQRIPPKEILFQGIMEKWKILLYGLDKDIQPYCNCLGFSQKNFISPLPQLQNTQMVRLEQQGCFVMQDQERADLIFHECFVQIQKDLDRTFHLPELKKKSFENVLKRIANHFPKMGYTQGINFIVGYLIIVGYSESDCFWMFAHIAISKRYMLLGLYEDGFPLSNVYTVIFKNMLKRLNSPLYIHLFEKLLLDTSLWVFKWFITYYLYSFPLEMCKYVWDFVIEIGGIGLVTFALALTLELQKHLFSYDDACDISQFFQSMKDLAVFNSILNINKVVEKAYLLKPNLSDFNGVSQCHGGFYGDYFQAHANEQQTQPKQHQDISSNEIDTTKATSFKAKPIKQSISLLLNWYSKIEQERKQFLQVKFHPQKHFTEISSLQIDELSQINLIKLTKEIEKISILSDLKTEKIPMKVISQNSLRHPKKIKPYDLAEEINQLWDEEESNSKKSARNKNEPTDILDELDKFTHENQDNFMKKSLRKISSMYPNEAEPTCQPNVYAPKINNFNLRESTKFNEEVSERKTGFLLIGQTVLSNLTGSSRQSQGSVQSKNTVCNRVKKHGKKEGKILKSEKRVCGCAKMKTEENKQSSIDRSEQESSVDRESISNQSNQEDMIADALSIRMPESQRERLSTHHDYMINSHGPTHNQPNIIEENHKPEIASDIELFHGPQLFKKKNRIPRGSGISKELPLNTITKNKETTHICILDRQIPARSKDEAEEESCESIFIPVSEQKCEHRQKLDLQSFEVESVK